MSINHRNEISPAYTYVLAATFLPHLSIFLSMGSVGPLAPVLQTDLHMSRAQIGMLTSAHSLGWIFMALASGGLVERTGVRLWLLLSPVITGVLTILFSGITSFIQGILIFFMLGLLFSFLNPATTKAIIQSFPAVRRGTAIAVKQTGGPVGVFLASVSLPAIALGAGWETGMVLVGLVNILVGISGWFLYKEGNRPAGLLNHPGTFKNDLSKLFHNMDFLLISFLQGIFNVVQFVLQSYLVLFLMESVGSSIIEAGFVMAVSQVFGIVGRLAWGVMSDFMFAGRRIPTLLAASLTTVAGVLVLAMTGQTTPFWVIMIAASLAGAGSIGYGGTSILLRAETAGKELAATSTSIGMAIAAWGVLVGPPVFGYIVDATGSYNIAWGVIATVSIAATLMLRFLHEPAPAPGD